jgi:hypothetical protein
MLKMDIIHAIANGANSVEKVKRKTYATMGGVLHAISRAVDCMHLFFRCKYINSLPLLFKKASTPEQ